MKRIWLGGFGALLALTIGTAVIAKQPPPPAVRAVNGGEQWREVLPPDDQDECETRCRANGEYEVCAAPLCAASAHPLLTIRSIDARITHPGDDIEIGGNFGAQRDDHVLALVDVRAEGNRRRQRLSVRHRIEVLRWNDHRIVARLHDEIDSGREYGLVILYNLTEGGSVAPIFKQGSNIVFLEIRNRR